MVLPLWVVENRPSPLLWPLAYTAACTTVQAVIVSETKRDISSKSPYFIPLLYDKSLREKGCEYLLAVFFITEPDPLFIR